MKKRLLLIAAGAVMLSGCSDNDYATYQDCSQADHTRMDASYQQCVDDGANMTSAKRYERHLSKCMHHTKEQYCAVKIYRLKDSVPETKDDFEPESEPEQEATGGW